MRLISPSIALALVSLVALAAVPACGARGPLDDGSGQATASADASTDDADVTPVVDAAPDVAQVDAGKEAGSILDCGICLFGQCQKAITTCIGSTECTAAFQCVFQTCLGSGGGLDPTCLLQCAAGSPTGALQVFQVFQCVAQTCGADCGSLLGGLGGLGGGGGGGGGGGKTDAGKSGGGGKGGGKEAFSRSSSHPLAKAFSAWPALITPIDHE